jgi:hypothetical protein
MSNYRAEHLHIAPKLHPMQVFIHQVVDFPYLEFQISAHICINPTCEHLNVILLT